MKQKHVSVRLPSELAQALEKYCQENFVDRSTVLRTAFIQWEPIRKYLERIPEQHNKGECKND